MQMKKCINFDFHLRFLVLNSLLTTVDATSLILIFFRFNIASLHHKQQTVRNVVDFNEKRRLDLTMDEAK